MTENENARNNNQALNTVAQPATVKENGSRSSCDGKWSLSLDDGQDFCDKGLCFIAGA